MRVLVTGADGFVGRSVCRRLLEAGHEVVAACRTSGREPAGTRPAAIGAIERYDAWRHLFHEIEAVVHLAAVTHATDLESPAAVQRYASVNVRASRRMAEGARDAGVGHLVYMSSIKVNGEATPAERGFRFDDPAAPGDNYGASKWQAEQALKEIAEQGGPAVTVLRPPLVYGPGMKGNLLALMRWIARGRALPLGRVVNRRSLLYAGNLAGAVVLAVQNPAAATRGYTLADTDISTSDLVRAIARALGVEPRNYPCPVWLLRGLGRLSGRRRQIERLTGSLVVDSTSARDGLGWEPETSFEQAMRETAGWFLAAGK